jgi:hypothetical protein
MKASQALDLQRRWSRPPQAGEPFYAWLPTSLRANSRKGLQVWEYLLQESPQCTIAQQVWQHHKHECFIVMRGPQAWVLHCYERPTSMSASLLWEAHKHECFIFMGVLQVWQPYACQCQHSRELYNHERPIILSTRQKHECPTGMSATKVWVPHKHECPTGMSVPQAYECPTSVRIQAVLINAAWRRSLISTSRNRTGG